MQFADRDAFVAFMTADQPPRPANIANIVAINQGRRPLTFELPDSRPLAPDTVAALQQAGHLVIDTRRAAQFSAAHLPASLNVQLASPEFEQRVGWLAREDENFVLVLETDELAVTAVRALAFVGLDTRVIGHLAGGIDAWQATGRATHRLEEIDAVTLHKRLWDGQGILVLDVRERGEWEAGHVPGSRQLSYKVLQARVRELAADLGDGALAVICHSGGRSSTASSILGRAGFTRVIAVAGGLQAWIAAGLPVERSLAVRVPRP